MANPVIIVGAGLAGLACAQELKRKNIPILVVEASDAIGGRLRTDTVDGFTLDRGFQVTFSSYPHQAHAIDLRTLGLHQFEPGALCYQDGKLHEVHRDKHVAMAASPYLPFADKLRIESLNIDSEQMSLDDIWHLRDRSAATFLTEYGFSETFLERFIRPFFGGIFLDRSLSVSARSFLFIWKMLLHGQTVVPGRGIAEIPTALARSLASNEIMLNSRVAGIDGANATITLGTGETIYGRSVVLATDLNTTNAFLGKPDRVEYRSTTCVYFSCTMPPVDRPILVLNAAREGVVNEIVPVSIVAPETAPAGQHLVSATLIGAKEADPELIKREVSAWFPDRSVSEWQHLRTYQVPVAQLLQLPGWMATRPTPGTDHPRLVLAGEYITNSSIDGAIESGIQTARLVVAAQ